MMTDLEEGNEHMTMHWVVAMTPEGTKALVNLAAVPSMARTEGEDAVTILFLGGVCMLGNGAMVYAQTRVKETPEELLARPVFDKLSAEFAVKRAALSAAAAVPPRRRSNKRPAKKRGGPRKAA